MSSGGSNLYDGWQGGPDGRGTWDVLKNCGGTIILLCWTSVCPNVSGTKGNWLQRQGGRASLFLLAVLGPDFIFMLALGQLQAARTMKRRFHEAGFTKHWDLRQCFFANMGGFHVRPHATTGSRTKSFAVNAQQMLFLVQSGCMKMPEVTREEISDRNKTDGLARAIAIIQVVWFTAETLARIPQGLAITTLEITTLAFIFLLTLTVGLWWHKPMGIERPIVIDLTVDLETIKARAKSHAYTGNLAYGGTPLSFIGRNEWFLSRHWFYYTELLRKLRLIPRPEIPYEAEFFPSIEYYLTPLKVELFAAPCILAYGIIFLAPWNFSFPSPAEQILWRTAALVCAGYSILGCLICGFDQHGRSILRHLRRGLRRQSNSVIPICEEKSTTSQFEVMRQRISASFDWIRNVSPDKDPALRIRLRTLLPVTFMCAIYSITRAYILVEDLISLRSLPESAFATVDWSKYSPIF